VKAVFSYAGLITLAVFLMAPFVWMVMVSLQAPGSPIPDLGHLWPKEMFWSNYRTVLFMPEQPVFRYFLNSVLITSAVVVGSLLVCSMAAYGFARLEFRGKGALFSLFLVSMMFAGTVTQIPVFLIVRSFGWLDTYWALIVPGVSSAFNIFLLRQFFMAVPRELDEAARMDGASEFRIYRSVIMPLSRPALATCAAFSFFAVWTDFFWPLLATSSVRMRTLELGLSVFKNSYGATNWPLQMTAAVIVLLPLIVVFLVTQKHFVRGMMVGSVK
jgi:multiple sugar transport system permease protein